MESTTATQTSTRSQEASAGPLPAYDLFLRALGDSYLNFFAERLHLEEQYRDGMTRLLARQRNIDALFEERLPDRDWSLRRAWRDVCDGLDREVDVRAAFINSLRTDIVNPLQDLKETHERSRKRIKEDVKNSWTQYSDYGENTLPRLRRAYFKRCADADELRGNSIDIKAPVTSPVISSPVIPKQGGPLVQSPSTIAPSSSPPERGQRGRQSSVGQQTKRDRSPSAATSFADLAQQGRRQLNNLRTLIETKGGASGSGKAEIGIRGVRAKRDAEEADKEYRKGVHEMETLRLRREKILEAGYTSLETLVSETAELMVKVIERYADNLIATNATGSQVSTGLHGIAHQICPSYDLHHLRQLTSKTLAAAIPKPTLYQNYQIGECKDMLFGVSLVDYASSRSLRDHELPKIVSLCIAEIDTRGLKTEGIYRVSGRHANVMELSLMAEKSEVDFHFDRTKDDVHTVAALLKLYLRELPEPVFKFPMSERFEYTKDRDRYLSNNLAMIRSKIRRLPAIHQSTLRAMLEHLAKVAANQKSNKMDAKNLAVVFGPVILGEEPLPAGVDLLTMTKDTLMEDLINSTKALYDSHPSDERSSSPPLPEPPAHEFGVLNSRPTAPVYGSSHTVIKNLPAGASRSQTNVASESANAAVPMPGSATSETPPKLPPRPAHRQQRRNTLPSGTVDTGAILPAAEVTSAKASTPALGRPSEDGRASSSRPTSTAKPKLDTRSHTTNPSVSSTNSIRGKVSGTSSPTTSSIATTGASTQNVVSTIGTSQTTVSTTATSNKREAEKQPSYSDSLLNEPAVLMSQAQENEKEAPFSSYGKDSGVGHGNVYGGDAGEVEVDYPGSPDTSALEFKTAENTPMHSPKNEEPPRL
ncbi:hypothetical protein FRC19_002817 [Serendipita sp. 401]|nr:hypothetical protein FRC19_002817 [Serendipita sp. 401]